MRRSPKYSYLLTQYNSALSPVLSCLNCELVGCKKSEGKTAARVIVGLHGTSTTERHWKSDNSVYLCGHIANGIVPKADLLPTSCSRSLQPSFLLWMPHYTESAPLDSSFSGWCHFEVIHYQFPSAGDALWEHIRKTAGSVSQSLASSNCWLWWCITWNLQSIIVIHQKKALVWRCITQRKAKLSEPVQEKGFGLIMEQKLQYVAQRRFLSFKFLVHW